jgi:hypothetical protein
MNVDVGPNMASRPIGMGVWNPVGAVRAEYFQRPTALSVSGMS